MRTGWIKSVMLTFAIGIAILVLEMFTYRERETYVCPACGSQRDVFAWHFGTWSDWDLPLSPKSARVRLSQAYTDFFPASHVHTWQFSQGSPYFFFGTKWGGCALGRRGLTSNMVVTYAMDPAFRDFVLAKVKAGELTRQQAADLFAAPDPKTGGGKAPGDALVDAYNRSGPTGEPATP